MKGFVSQQKHAGMKWLARIERDRLKAELDQVKRDFNGLIEGFIEDNRRFREVEFYYNRCRFGESFQVRVPRPFPSYPLPEDEILISVLLQRVVVLTRTR